MTCHFNSPTWRGISVSLYNKLTIIIVGHTYKACWVIKQITSWSEHIYQVDAPARDSTFQMRSKCQGRVIQLQTIGELYKTDAGTTLTSYQCFFSSIILFFIQIKLRLKLIIIAPIISLCILSMGLK